MRGNTVRRQVRLRQARAVTGSPRRLPGSRLRAG